MFVGTLKCINTKCGQTVQVVTTGKDGLNLSCKGCGLVAYAKSGTDALADLKPLVTPSARATPSPTPKPAAKSKERMPWEA